MANTTNYNWETPDDTDLVKDGAAAIRTLGNSVDTTTKALNPSTTLGDIEYRSSTSNTNVRLGIGSAGQVLTVASGVPSWATPTGDIEGVSPGVGITGGGTSGTVTITNDMATTITASGDIVVGTGSGTYDNLPIGSTGQVLTADTTVSPYKVKWATPTSGAATFVGCRVFKSTAQSIPNATSTAVTFNSEDFDTDGFHSTSTNTSRITVPSGKAGYYLIIGKTYYNAVASVKVFGCGLLKNGTTGIGSMEIDSSVVYETGRQVSGISYLNVGDYVELTAYQETGGNTDVTQNNARTSLMVALLGA